MVKISVPAGRIHSGSRKGKKANRPKLEGETLPKLGTAGGKAWGCVPAGRQQLLGGGTGLVTCWEVCCSVLDAATFPLLFKKLPVP